MLHRMINSTPSLVVATPLRTELATSSTTSGTFSITVRLVETVVMHHSVDPMIPKNPAVAGAAGKANCVAATAGAMAMTAKG